MEVLCGYPLGSERKASLKTFNFHHVWHVAFTVADLSPIHFGKQSATHGTKPDLNIGNQGLALIQGQIYNSEVVFQFFLSTPSYTLLDN